MTITVPLWFAIICILTYGLYCFFDILENWDKVPIWGYVVVFGGPMLALWAYYSIKEPIIACIVIAIISFIYSGLLMIIANRDKF